MLRIDVFGILLTAALVGISSGIAEAGFVVTPAGYSAVGDLQNLTPWDTTAPGVNYSFFTQGGNVVGYDVKTQLGLSFTPIEYYKKDFKPASEATDLAGWDYYSAVDSINPNPQGYAPENGMITWDGPEKLNTEFVYLLLKDGSHGHYVMDVSTWDRTDDLIWAGFWPDKGSLSHVSLFGYSSSSDRPPFITGEVPEPASIALWASVATCGAFARRRRQLKIQG